MPSIKFLLFVRNKKYYNGGLSLHNAYNLYFKIKDYLIFNNKCENLHDLCQA